MPFIGEPTPVLMMWDAACDILALPQASVRLRGPPTPSSVCPEPVPSFLPLRLCTSLTLLVAQIHPVNGGGLFYSALLCFLSKKKH